MDAYIYTKLISLLAGLLTVWMGARVGAMRGKHSVKAPDCHGPDEFNNTFRGHQNTLESMIVFIPTLWIFASVVNDLYAGILGGVWLVGRLIYFLAYCKEPSKRTMGFLISFLAMAVMLVWALVKVGIVLI